MLLFLGCLPDVFIYFQHNTTNRPTKCSSFLAAYLLRVYISQQHYTTNRPANTPLAWLCVYISQHNTTNRPANTHYFYWLAGWRVRQSM